MERRLTQRTGEAVGKGSGTKRRPGVLRQGIALLATMIACAAPARAETTLPPVRIVLFAGPKQHGSPGRHEYEKDLRELAWLLEHSGAARTVKTEVIVGQKPRDLASLASADAIVIDGNGDWLKRETGALFPQ